MAQIYLGALWIMTQDIVLQQEKYLYTVQRLAAGENLSTKGLFLFTAYPRSKPRQTGTFASAMALLLTLVPNHVEAFYFFGEALFERRVAQSASNNFANK